jgi:hypothetical protein
VTPAPEKANSVPLTQLGGDLACWRRDQNRKCICQRKSMKNMTPLLSNLEQQIDVSCSTQEL